MPYSFFDLEAGYAGMVKIFAAGCNFCPPARQLAGSGYPEAQEVKTGLLFHFVTF